MNCLDFLDRLRALADGTCPAGEREDAERHAAACDACGELLRDARAIAAEREAARPSGLDEEDADSLVGEVIRRTTGSGGACSRAEELLCELLFDQRASDVSVADPLLAQHLQHCASCAALAASLSLASRVLPTFAEIDPGPGFATAVFAWTSRAAREPETALARLAAWWRAWMARPRFAFELAYVATLVLVLLVGNPAATLQAASARTVTAAAAGLERARTAWPSALPSLEVPASVRALGAVTGEVLAQQSALGQMLDKVMRGASEFWSSAWSWLNGATSDLVSRVKAMWRTIVPPPPQNGAGEPGSAARR